MLKRMLPALFALALLLVAVPAHAAERITPAELPQLNWPSTYRLRHVITLNKVPVAFARAEFIDDGSNFRLHGWWTELKPNGEPGLVMEHIGIGPRVYWRINNAPRWNVSEMVPAPLLQRHFLFLSDFPHPDFLHPDYVITRLGEVEVDGVPSQQYQFELSQSRLPSYLTMAKRDLFVGTEDAIVHKEQWSLTYAGEEPILAENAMHWFDHGADVVIEAPPAELVDEFTASGLAVPVPGAEFLPVWAHMPLAHALASTGQ